MADQRGSNSKRSKFSKTSVAKKALLTSSASRRFRAEGEDPQHEEDIKQDSGATGISDPDDVLEEERRQQLEYLAEEEKFRQDRLLANIPEHLRGEALRRAREIRRERELKKREDEQRATEAIRSGTLPSQRAAETSRYVTEDQAASRLHHDLSVGINHQADAEALAQGGPTIPGAGSYEEQITTAGGRGEPDRVFERPSDIEWEELFGAPEPRWQSRIQEQRAYELVARRKALKTLENKMKEREQVRRGSPAPERTKGIPRPQRPVEPRSDFEKALLIEKGDRRVREGRASTNPYRKPSPPRARYPQSLADEETANLALARRKVQEEREKVEQELNDIKPDALVGEKRGTPKETEEYQRRLIERGFSSITDPTSAPSKRTGLRRTIKPEEVVPPKQIEEFVKHATASHHAATPELRAQSAQQARRLLGQITQQARKVLDDKQEEADRQQIIRELLPNEAYTHEGFIKRSVSTVGVDPYERLQQQRAQGEAHMRPPKAKTGSFAEDLKVARGQRPFSPPTGMRQVQPDSFIDPNRGSPFGPYKDPRLNELTSEDVYSAYGHEQILPRLQWEKDRLKAKFADTEFMEPKPKLLHSLKQQGKFIGTQAKARAKGFIEGTEVIGFSDKGRPMALPGRTQRTVIGSNPNARFGLTPNIEYQYEIRNPRADSDEAVSRQNTLNDLKRQREEVLSRMPKTGLSTKSVRQTKVKKAQRVEKLRHALNEARPVHEQLMTLDEAIKRQQARVDEVAGPKIVKVLPSDTRTQFGEGRRDRKGNLLFGERDEITAPVLTHAQQDTNVRVRFGERQPKTGKETPGDNVDEIRYVPSPGAKGETRTIKDPEGSTKTIPVLIDTEGKEHTDITRDEWNEARRERNRWDSTPPGRRHGVTPPRAEEKTVPRKVQYKYVDPKNLELTGAARDIASIKIPGRGRLGERLLHLQFSEHPESLMDKIPGRLARVHGEAERLDAARQISQSDIPRSDLLAQHGIRDKSEAKVLMEAATAAGFYANRDRFMKGHLPNMAQKVVNRLPGSEYNAPVFDINEAFVRPGIEKIAQVPRMIQNPLSSPTGHATGLEFSSIKYRTTRIRQQTLARRALERDTERLKRIQKTAEFVEKHKADKSLLGTYTRWRMAPLSRSPGYELGKQEGILHDIATKARAATNDNIVEYDTPKGNRGVIRLDPIPLIRGTGKKPLSQLEKVENARRIRENARRQSTTRAAAELQGTYSQVKRTLEHKPFSPVDRGPGLMHKGMQKSGRFVSKGIHESGSERNILIGGAVVGTAAGAAYLYRRHQENKKPDEERVALYNKVLPKAFSGPPMPKARVTKTVRFGDTPGTRELGLAKKELPVQVGVRTERRRIALRPVDRGYSPNLPIIGRPSFRGTPGGSKAKGLVYYGIDTPKRTSIKRSTHELIVSGRRLPGALNIGKHTAVQTSATNPHRMTAEDREDLIWAYSGTDREEHVKAFYRGAGGDSARRLLEAWDSPDEVARIRRSVSQRSPEARQYQRRAVRQYQRVTSAAR